MLCMASTKGTTLCCLMSRCWMGRWRSSFFVGMAYIEYQRFGLDLCGFYVNLTWVGERQNLSFRLSRNIALALLVPEWLQIGDTAVKRDCRTSDLSFLRELSCLDRCLRPTRRSRQVLGAILRGLCCLSLERRRISGVRSTFDLVCSDLRCL